MYADVHVADVEVEEAVRGGSRLQSGLVVVVPVACGDAFGVALFCEEEVGCLHWRGLSYGIEHLIVYGMNADRQAADVEVDVAVHGGSHLQGGQVVVVPVSGNDASGADCFSEEEVGGPNRAPLVPGIEPLQVQGMNRAFCQQADINLYLSLAVGRTRLQGGRRVVEPVAIAEVCLSPCRACQGKERDKPC